MDIPVGWTLDDIACTSRDSTSDIGVFTPGETAIDVNLAVGDLDIGGNEVQFIVAPGNDVRCTFTDESPPRPLIFRNGLETVP